MDFSKAIASIALPCLAIVGALFLNIANAQLLLLAWVLFSLWSARDIDSSLEAPALTMVLFSTWITLAQFWSGVGSIGWFTTWTFLAIPLAYVGWLFHSRYRPAAWHFMQNFLGFLGSLLAVWGIIQVAALGYTRAVGPLSDPNTYGCLLNILWFPLFTHFLSSKQNEAKLYGVVLFVVQMALMMSGSRTASLIWLLLFAAIALLLWNTVSRARLVFICAIAAGNYFIYSLHSGHLAVSSYEAAISIPHTAPVAHFPRLLMWQSTIHMWLDSPWFGGGLGSWNYIYPAYRIADESGTSGYFAHNDYLQLLQEGGAVFIVIFVGLIGWFYLGNIRKLATNSGLERIENLGLLAGITAVILHATVNFSFYLIYINILVGIYFGRLSQVPGQVSQPSQQKSGVSSGSLNKAISGMMLMVIAVNGFHAMLTSAGLSLLRSESIAWKAVHVIAPASSPYSVAVLLASIRPSDTNAQRYIAASLKDEVINNQTISPQQARGMFDEIVSDYELMRTQNKYDAAIPAYEAGFLIDFGLRYGSDSSRLQTARKLLQESLRNDPSRVDSAILLAETYVQTGELQTAYGILAGMIPKAWRERDRMIIEAEILKLRMPQHTKALSDIQQELRSMRVNCRVEECGEKYAKIVKTARQTLDNLGKEASSDSRQFP